MGESMRIVELRAENFKRLRAIRIRPDGTAVVLGGRNGAGKTSALDAIWAALAGAKALPPEPIRRGEKTASVTVELGAITVTRRFRKGGSRLEVTTADGSSMKSPQSVLDRLVGELSFDPLAFARQRPKDQAETLRRLAGLDLSDLDAKEREIFEERAAVNRSTKRLQGSLESMPEVEDVEPVDVAELVAHLEAAQKQNAERRAAIEERDSLQRRHAELCEQIEALEARLLQLRKVAEGVQAKLDAGLTAPEYIDEAPIRQRLSEASTVNARAEQARRRREVEAELADSRRCGEELTAQIEKVRQERERRIEQADYPIEGLGVSDEGVTFRGLPLEQASSAEQVRVSAAIGMALNPRLRVLLIRDGSLLDEDSLAALVAQAEAADAQLWIEKVSEDGAGCSVVIEDGEVRDA